MKIVMQILMIIAVAAVITGVIVMGREVIKNPTPEVRMTRQQIILECEKLSAVAINDAWSYKQCIENLENPENAKILQI